MIRYLNFCLVDVIIINKERGEGKIIPFIIMLLLYSKRIFAYQWIGSLLTEWEHLLETRNGYFKLSSINLTVEPEKNYSDAWDIYKFAGEWLWIEMEQGVFFELNPVL